MQATAWVNLDDSVQCEISQLKMDRDLAIPLLRCPQREGLHRHRKQNVPLKCYEQEEWGGICNRTELIWDEEHPDFEWVMTAQQCGCA